jgi:hypothetical protein
VLGNLYWYSCSIPNSRTVFPVFYMLHNSFVLAAISDSRDNDVTDMKLCKSESISEGKPATTNKQLKVFNIVSHK